MLLKKNANDDVIDDHEDEDDDDDDNHDDEDDDNCPSCFSRALAITKFDRRSSKADKKIFSNILKSKNSNLEITSYFFCK